MDMKLMIHPQFKIIKAHKRISEKTKNTSMNTDKKINKLCRAKDLIKADYITQFL